MHLHNKSNCYADELGELFNDMPKTVLAAIAVSALTCGGDHLDRAKHRVSLEWLRLFNAQIVPQKPTACARNLAAQAEAAGEGL